MRLLMILFLFLQGPTITKDELLGKFNPAEHPDFVKVHLAHANREGLYLRKETYEAYQRMFEAAARQGVNLQIVSATRNFNYQKGIWERKWDRPKYMGWQDIEKAKDIMKYSSMPGTSRHHWGTDIDLNKLENDWFEKGEGLKVYNWLTQNAGNYGFAQVYTSKADGRTGYEEEKWHWSYMPLSVTYLAEYSRIISYEDLDGFDGHNAAQSVKAIDEYVKGVEE